MRDITTKIQNKEYEAALGSINTKLTEIAGLNHYELRNNLLISKITCLYYLKRYSECIENIYIAQKKIGSSIESHKKSYLRLLLSKCFQVIGNNEQALTALHEKIEPEDRHFAKTQLLKASILQNIGKIQEAWDCISVVNIDSVNSEDSLELAKMIVDMVYFLIKNKVPSASVSIDRAREYLKHPCFVNFKSDELRVEYDLATIICGILSFDDFVFEQAANKLKVQFESDTRCFLPNVVDKWSSLLEGDRLYYLLANYFYNTDGNVSDGAASQVGRFYGFLVNSFSVKNVSNANCSIESKSSFPSSSLKFS